MGAGAALALASAYLFGRWVVPLLPTTPNYRGRPVAQAVGVALFLPAMLVRPPLALLAGALALGMVGLLDDFASRGEPRGWAGHARALGQGRLTCGGVKALTGIAVALMLGTWRTAPLLALGPNLVNTIDTRPGRAILFYLLAAVPLIWIAPAGLVRAAPFAAAALGLLPLDLGERAMLGDVGANALGFALAYAWAAAPGLTPLLAAAAALAVITVGDRVSLGRVGTWGVPPRRSHLHPGE